MIIAVTFTSEIAWADLLVHLIFWPTFILCLRYAYFLCRYSKILGLYEGLNKEEQGKSLVTIKLRFLCVFRITCTEGKGQTWEGKSYKINDEGNYLTGLYVWNPNQKQNPDIGEHKIFFSENRARVVVHWHNLTSPDSHDAGLSNWVKAQPNKGK